MDHKSLINAFKDIFPSFNVDVFKKIDSHSLEIKVKELPENRRLIWTFYNESSFKLETK